MPGPVSISEVLCTGGLGFGVGILAAADRHGGREAWGLQELLPGRLHADSGVLLGKLLPLRSGF